MKIKGAKTCGTPLSASSTAGSRCSPPAAGTSIFPLTTTPRTSASSVLIRMSVQEASPTLAIRLERTLHSFLEAVTANRGLEDYIDNLAGLFKEVLLEKELGRLDQRTSDLGASVATALQGMSSVFLDITQQGRRIKMQLDEGRLGPYKSTRLQPFDTNSLIASDIIRRVKAHQQPRSRSNAQANASDLHGLVDDASPAAPTSSVRLLRNWFLAHLEHPFPTAEEKATLCSTVDMSVGQVNGWCVVRAAFFLLAPAASLCSSGPPFISAAELTRHPPFVLSLQDDQHAPALGASLCFASQPSRRSLPLTERELTSHPPPLAGLDPGRARDRGEQS